LRPPSFPSLATCSVPLAPPFIFSFAPLYFFSLFFFNDTAPTEIYTLSLHDALPISHGTHYGHSEWVLAGFKSLFHIQARAVSQRSEEHTSELQSRENLVCRLLLEKKKKNKNEKTT